jgi:hypothetical protein
MIYKKLICHEIIYLYMSKQQSNPKLHSNPCRFQDAQLQLYAWFTVYQW